MTERKQDAMGSISYMVRIGEHLLRPDHVVEIDSKIREFLSAQQPFLKHCYSLKQMAEDTHIPLHQLSAVINQHYRMHFNDFINYHRVLHCKQKILNEEWKQKKLEAIGIESGFNNRNTFSTAFKKVLGINPSEYLKNIKEKHSA